MNIIIGFNCLYIINETGLRESASSMIGWQRAENRKGPCWDEAPSKMILFRGKTASQKAGPFS